MGNQRPTAYGQANTPKETVPIPAAASQPFEAGSGKWVVLDAGRNAVIASNTNIIDLIGWAEIGTMSTSSTAGQDIIAVNVNNEAVYEMPINATQSESQLKMLIGKSCDIALTSTIQYANHAAATDNTLEIVGYKYYGVGTGEQSLLVRRYKPTISVTSVA